MDLDGGRTLAVDAVDDSLTCRCCWRWIVEGRILTFQKETKFNIVVASLTLLNWINWYFFIVLWCCDVADDVDQYDAVVGIRSWWWRCFRSRSCCRWCEHRQLTVVFWLLGAVSLQFMYAVISFADSQSNTGYQCCCYRWRVWTCYNTWRQCVDFVWIGATKCLGRWRNYHIVVGRSIGTLLAWYGWIIAGQWMRRNRHRHIWWDKSEKYKQW